MNEIFFIQLLQVKIDYNIHLGIIIATMIVTGMLGGYAGYLIEKNKVLRSDLSSIAALREDIKKEKKYFLITGICAALLIPLFLSTISSQLMKESQEDPLKYFVFGGFCLLVAIFSKQFISSLSDKILKQVKEEVQLQTKEKVERAFDEQSGLITEKVEKEVSIQTSGIQSKLSVWDDFVKLESQIKHPSNPKRLELDDLVQILDSSLQTGEPELPSQVYDRVSILCYDQKRDDLMEKINELYKDKIKLSPYAWADLAISNMNKYNQTRDAAMKTKTEEYVSRSLKELPDYGAAYAVRLYLHVIEYLTPTTDTQRKNELTNQMKDVFKKIKELGPITSREAFNYVKANEATGYAVYNKQLIQLLPEEWNELEKTAATVK